MRLRLSVFLFFCVGIFLVGCGPRETRVTAGNRDGILLARVQKLGASADVSRGLIAAGFAEPLIEPMACR